MQVTPLHRLEALSIFISGDIEAKTTDCNVSDLDLNNPKEVLQVWKRELGLNKNKDMADYLEVDQFALSKWISRKKLPLYIQDRFKNRNSRETYIPIGLKRIRDAFKNANSINFVHDAKTDKDVINFILQNI